MRTKFLFLVVIASLAIVSAGTGCESCHGSEETSGSAVRAPAEPLEPLPPIATDARKVAIGRRLFHDRRLSGDGTLACVTCHSFEHGGAEDRKTSIGIRGQVGPINAPTVLNAALNFVQFWDGRAATLAEQAGGPVTNPIEMGSTWDDVIARVSADETYRAEFAAAFSDGITQANVADALVEYEKTLLTPSRFDRYLKGDRGAITEAERDGYETFKSVGCPACHVGPNVGGSMYQKMGAVRDYFTQRGNPTAADLGRYNVSHDEQDRHRFKVPSLRNVALTSPYLHDGSQQTLDDVVRVMGRYQLGRELTPEQVRSIVAFLHSLTGELPRDARLESEPGAVAPTVPPAHR